MGSRRVGATGTLRMEPSADEAEPTVSRLTQDLLTDGTLPSYPIAIDLSAPRFQLASVSEGLALARANVLRELHLGSNALTSLDGISRFEALRVLRAPNNRIVDATIRCPRLTLLDLSSNQLGSLPLLQGCAALLTLDVTDNSIRSGLDHLRHVPRLQVLLLGGNSLGAGGSAEQAAFGQALRGLSRLTRTRTRTRTLSLTPALTPILTLPHGSSTDRSCIGRRMTAGTSVRSRSKACTYTLLCIHTYSPQPLSGP